MKNSLEIGIEIRNVKKMLSLAYSKRRFKRATL